MSEAKIDKLVREVDNYKLSTSASKITKTVHDGTAPLPVGQPEKAPPPE